MNCATGTFWHQFTDFSVPGRGVALDLTRTYSSDRAAVNGPFGYGWTDSYDISLTVDSSTGNVTINQEDGSPITFLPNGSGAFTAPPRVLASLVQNSDGTYTFIRDSTQVQYTFSATGQLIRQVDLNGYLTSLAYNSSGQLATVTDPAGRTLTFTYTGGNVTSVTDPMGRAWAYTYDSSGNLATASDPLGRQWTFSYDASHLMLSMTDPRGGTTTNTYNGSGQVVTQVDPNGGTTAFTWSGDPSSSAGATNTVTDPNGIVTQYQYANMELVSVTRGYGTSAAATTRYTYDPATLGVTTVTDPDGQVTTNTYDSSGNLLSTTNPDGEATSYQYNAFNEITDKTTPLGEATSYAYDANGNLVSVGDPTGGTTGYTYGNTAAPGDVTSMTNPDGDVTTYTYDNYGDVASATTTPSTGVTDTVAYAYDADGERTCAASPNATANGIACPAAGAAQVAGTTATAYDGDGEVTSVTDPDGHVTAYAYDADGNKASLTDAAGHVTQYAYDADNRQVAITQADGKTQATAYDADGNPVKQVNAAGAVTAYAYDALSRLISATDPLGHVTTYGYDAADNRTSVTNPQGQVTTYGYDPAGRETTVSYSDGKTPGVTYTYDADGRRAAMADGTGTTNYAYDGDGRVTSVTNGAGSTVSYGYDLAGLLASLSYPNGQVVTRSYDGASRVASISDGLGNTTTFSYDHDGNPTSQADPNGVTVSSTYDPADQLTGISDKTSAATLQAYSYTRDSLGDVARVTETGTVAGTQGYSYTQLSQLASDSSGSYGYDPAGDLTGQPGGVTQAFNADGQLTSSTQPGTPAAPMADAVASATAAPASPVAPVLDRAVSATQASKGATIVSPALTTKSAGELIVAFVSASGPVGNAQQITAVNGGGLTWHLVVRSDGQAGTSEAWQAYAASVITSAKVTATLRYRGYDGAITLAAFTGARSATGAHAAASGATGAPSVSLSTTGTNSLVWAVGEDPTHATARTVVSGQALVYDSADATGHDTFWAQRTGTIAKPRTTVKVADSTPTADKWNLTAVEILAAVSAVPPITSPAVTTKAAGELVLAFVSANGPAGNAQQVTGVTGGGLSWSRVAQSHGQQGTTEVWQAHATATLTAAHISATLAYPGHDGAITVATFTGAGTATGADAAGSGATGAPSVSLTTTGAQSLVWAAGEDPAHATARTAASGQSLVADSADTAGSDTFWTQKVTSAVAAGGTTVKVADTAPTADKWNLVAVEIPAAAPGTVSDAYTYNANGDLTTITPGGGTTATLAYDQSDRLISYGTSVTYTYDGDGLRMSAAAGTSTMGFAWDQSGSLPQLIAAGTIYYVYGPGGTPIEQVDTGNGNAVSYLLTDHQGSTRLITSPAGAVTGTYTYGSYGVVTRHTGTTAALQYDGQYTDGVTGLQYLRSRYYNPATGQFLTQDPLVPVSGQAYGFTWGDPVNLADPNGQCPLCVTAIIGGVVGGLVGGVSGYLTCAASGKSGRGCADAVIGGAVGGVVSGACTGLTGNFTGCGAAGGAVGALASDLVDTWEGQDTSGTQIGADVLLGAGGGALGGAAHLKFFRPGGESPSSWSAAIRQALSKEELVGDAFDAAFGTSWGIDQNSLDDALFPKC